VARRRRAPAYQNALTQLDRPTGSATTTPGWWNIILEEYSHSPSPESFSRAASSAHQKDRLATALSSSPPTPRALRARRGARPAQQRPLRIRQGRERLDHRTERLFGRDMETKREVFEEACRRSSRCSKNRHRTSRQIFRHSAPQRGAKPVQSASAVVDVHARTCRPSNAPDKTVLARSAFQFVSAEAAHAWVHAYYKRDHQKRLKKLADYEINRTWRWCRFFHVRKTTEEDAGARRRPTSFQFALRFTTARRRTASVSDRRQRQHEGTNTKWKSARIRRRRRQHFAAADRLAGTIAKKLRRFRASHIDQVNPAQPGR